jgi:CBS domain-containing protein
MLLRDAAAKMRMHCIGCLPIVDDGKLVGITTVSDLLEAIERSAVAPSPRPRSPSESGPLPVAPPHRELRVFDLMSQPPETIEPSTCVRNAAAQMAGRKIGFLPVCEGGGALGVLTDRDITVRVVAVGLDPISTQVQEVMTRPVYGCAAEASLSEARRIMQINLVRRLVITDSAYRVVGVLALDDLNALPQAQAPS